MNKFKVMMGVVGAGFGLLAPLSGQTHFNPDADGDHMIGMQDILVIIGQYGSYDVPGECGWWTGSDIVGSEAWFRSMHTNNAGIQRTTFGLSAALSVRCVKN